MKALAVPLPLTVIPISFFCTRSPSDLDCARGSAGVQQRGRSVSVNATADSTAESRPRRSECTVHTLDRGKETGLVGKPRGKPP